jgi:hypothetical protein
VFSAIGGLALILGIGDVLWPEAVSRKTAIVLPLIVLAALVYGGVRSWPRPVEQHYTKPNTEINVVEGDLFDRGDDNLIIGFTTTFDTEVPNIIQKDGVQGQFLGRVFNNNQAALDNQLIQALHNIPPQRRIDKVGKQDVYPVGTVAVLRESRRLFFCVAYSEMSRRNVAQSRIDWMWSSLANVWEEVRANTNGGSVAIPVLGGGLSRISHILPAQDSVRFIALSFMFASRESKVCDRLNIVVRKQDIQYLDMPELQAFLTSLQAS